MSTIVIIIRIEIIVINVSIECLLFCSERVPDQTDSAPEDWSECSDEAPDSPLPVAPFLLLEGWVSSVGHGSVLREERNTIETEGNS